MEEQRSGMLSRLGFKVQRFLVAFFFSAVVVFNAKETIFVR